MKIALAVVSVLAVLAACTAYPYAPKQATTPGAFIGEGINGIAAALLQDSADKNCNAAYSPLGYSAILAALAEGASGKTRSQMLSALKLPQDSSLTRATYRSVLSRMREKNTVGKPEFRSWFYVYAKSIQLEVPFTNVLKDHYLMDVRDIQAIEEDTPEEFFVNKDDAPAAAPAPEAPVAPEAPAAPAAPETPAAPEAPAAPAEASEDIQKQPALDEPLAKPTEEIKEDVKEDEKKEELPVEAAIAQDAVVDAIDAIKAEIPAKEAEAADAVPQQEDTAKVGEAATSHHEEEEAVEKPAAVEDKVSLAKFGKDEKKPSGDKKKDDKKKGREAEDTNGRQPSGGPFLLTTFNALYYRGTWQVPFDAKFKDDFFVGDGRGETKEVTTIRTQGAFRIGDIKELNATAIELPYKGDGGRYSLLVLLPRVQDGLPKLTEALTKYSFRYLAKNMREKQVDVAIPEFEIDCISHPQPVFKKLGMTSMFEKEAAEFPGISKSQRLYLQDDGMAQLVRFKVDDKTAIANYLSAMSMSTRSGLSVFHANHPFVFYLRDNLDNLTILVGRVTDPTKRPDNSAFENLPQGPAAEVPEPPQEPEQPEQPDAE
ncbi:serpin H1-like [Thrips palmi]|uniref:Serpin H1-like n=1 Tax=Thrips palmi TaxID=161013 RepID=A0A6P8Z5A3_THRPL|nr:serpin H1-like [Thrips palmi]